MKNLIIILAVVALECTAAETNVLGSVERATKRERLHNRPTRATGGFVRKPGVGKGKILVLNAQHKAEFKNCKTVLYSLSTIMKLPMEYRDGGEPPIEPDAKYVRSLGADFAIFVVDRQGNKSTVLVSPEERWAIVNVARLMADAPTPTLLENRLHKEILRAFGWLCGAANSKANNTVMRAVGSYVDLDGIPFVEYPLDHYQPTVNYLKEMGVTPFVAVTYRRACQEGWAPAPTNEFQRAIWDEVHAPPSKPLKITYDKDKQKPVVK